jgi:hypothetical protein
LHSLLKNTFCSRPSGAPQLPVSVFRFIDALSLNNRRDTGTTLKFFDASHRIRASIVEPI